MFLAIVELVICKEPKVLQEALSVSAAYLPDSIEPDPYFYKPEMSGRVRGIETWAALNSLEQKGVIQLMIAVSPMLNYLQQIVRRQGSKY